MSSLRHFAHLRGHGLASALDDLCDNRHGHFPRRMCVDGESDGRMETGDVRLADPCITEAGPALAALAARAPHHDVAGTRVEGGRQRLLIDFHIVGRNAAGGPSIKTTDPHYN